MVIAGRHIGDTITIFAKLNDLRIFQNEVNIAGRHIGDTIIIFAKLNDLRIFQDEVNIATNFANVAYSTMLKAIPNSNCILQI